MGKKKKDNGVEKKMLSTIYFSPAQPSDVHCYFLFSL